MTDRQLHLVVPGSLNQRTGGYLYDARMVAGLRARGWRVDVHELKGRFPNGDRLARQSLAQTLDSLADSAWVVIDGLALGALPQPVRRHAARLAIVSLVHHPLAEETGLSDDERRRFRRLETEALAACRGAIVTSPFTARALDQYGVAATSVRVVTPGVDRGPLARGPRHGEAPRLLCVASVTPRKGQDVLLQALAAVGSLPWTCVCAGSLTRAPEFATEVQAQVQRLGLGDRVQLTGELDRPAVDALYDISSLFVLPSYYEGYGMVLTEALSRGLPIVATTGGAIPTTVSPETSILVSPGDTGALADALSRALAPAELARLSGAARRAASSLPDWVSAVAGFESAVADLCARQGFTTGSQ